MCLLRSVGGQRAFRECVGKIYDIGVLAINAFGINVGSKEPRVGGGEGEEGS